MAEQFVGKIAEFKDGDRRIIFAGDNEIGVFRHEASSTPTAISACTRAARPAKG